MRKNTGKLIPHLLECHINPGTEQLRKGLCQKTVGQRQREGWQKVSKYQVSEKLMILFWRIRVVWKRRMSSWYVNILFIFFSLGSLSFRNIIHSYGFSVIIITQPLSVSWSSGPVSRTGDITASGREWWERGTESSTWGIANESQGQPSLN